MSSSGLEGKDMPPAMGERERLAILRGYRLLDTPRESQFDDMAAIAATVCGTPIAVISLIDEQRQWFKSVIGLDVREVPRKLAFCDLTIRQAGLMVVEDLKRDARFARNPLVAENPYLRFYAGMPIRDREGAALGTVAVMDYVPRRLSVEQQKTLVLLGHSLARQWEVRRRVLDLERLTGRATHAQQALQRSHEELDRQMRDGVAALAQIGELLRPDPVKAVSDDRLSQAFIDSLQGVFYMVDTEGRFLRWNRKFEQVTGATPEEIRKAKSFDFIGSSEHRKEARATMQQIVSDGSGWAELDLRARDGKLVPFRLNGIRVQVDGKTYICGMGIDLTESRATEEALRLREQALESSRSAMIIADATGTIEYVNPAFERMIGYATDEVWGRRLDILSGQEGAHPEIRAALEERREGGGMQRCVRKDGQEIWVDFHITPVRDAENTVAHFVGVLNDVTALKRYEEQLERHANYDGLTGLPNRNLLKDRIRQAITGAEQHGGEVTVGFLDLDNFKFINDSLGHGVGDKLLKIVAERLSASLSAEHTVARYGGDEFSFVLVGMQSASNVGFLMERILQIVDRPIQIEGREFFISCSIGLSCYPRDGTDLDILMRNADTAMHRAKERGRNNFQFYTPAMNRRVTERLSMEAKLRRALANQELTLVYQPQIEIDSGRVVGMEALLRWRSENGEIAPAAFIPLAEETGLIVPIGAWVLHTACAHNKALQDAGLPPINVAVNISARQFHLQTLCEVVRGALGDSGMDATLLELELTESLLMENPEDVIQVLNELRDMGLCLAIDDFGTGYSSLSYLQRLPVGRLKIDQSFVRDIGSDPNDAIIARAVISLGHSLGMSVIAEGVSNREQLAFLRENGCDQMQGYLYSRPLPFEDMLALLKEGHPLAAH